MPYKDTTKQKEAQNKHYINNKEAYKERTIKKRKLRKEWFSNFLSTKQCIICGESCNAVLDLHHIDPTEKEETVSKLIAELRSFKRIISEIQKCVILCSNCHRKVHAGIINRIFTPEEKLVVDCKIPEEPRFKTTNH